MASYKRQRLSSDKSGAVVPLAPTKYETAPATLKNFPSSIVSDVTAEGGLFSLTFKSIGYVDFVEKLDLARGAIAPITGESAVINDLVKYDQAALETLQKEVEELKQEAAKQESKNEIARLQNKLELQLDNKGSLSEIGTDIVSFYESLASDRKLVFSEKDYSISKSAVPVKVQKFEDVANPDLSAYEKAAAEAKLLLKQAEPVVIEQPVEAQAVIEKPQAVPVREQQIGQEHYQQPSPQQYQQTPPAQHQTPSQLQQQHQVPQAHHQLYQQGIPPNLQQSLPQPQQTLQQTYGAQQNNQQQVPQQFIQQLIAEQQHMQQQISHQINHQGVPQVNSQPISQGSQQFNPHAQQYNQQLIPQGIETAESTQVYDTPSSAASIYNPGTEYHPSTSSEGYPQTYHAPGNNLR